MLTRYIDTTSEICKSFTRWAGRCDKSYVFSVYAADDIPAYEYAVFVVVRNTGTHLEPLMVGSSNALPEMFFLSRRYQAALKRGGNEVHVHVPAPNVDPKAVARDLTFVPARTDLETTGKVDNFQFA